MVMVPKVQERTTFEEFVHWSDGTDTRYELVRGRIVAMSPPSVAHSRLAGNMAHLIRRQLKPPCGVFVEAGIRPHQAGDTYYQADLTVSCAPSSSNAYAVPEPRLIVEVLSPSTEARDKRSKLPDYRALSSVQEIVLLSSQTYRAELQRRTDSGWFVEDLIGPESLLRLQSIPAELPFADIYEGIAF